MSSKNSGSIFVVLGMHKSGTTLVSRLLMEAGVHMGSFDMSRDYDAGNHLELEETQHVNKKLLGCGDNLSLHVADPVDLARVSSGMFDEGRVIVDRLSRAHSDWGFKDPRTCLTYAYWERVLPFHKLIVVYRHPAEVVMHYTRGKRLLGFPLRLVNAVRALACWEIYNREILDIVQRKDDALVLSFRELMTSESELNRLSAFVGRHIVDSRESGMYRSRGFRNFYYMTALVFSVAVLRRSPLSVYDNLERYRRLQAIVQT